MRKLTVKQAEVIRRMKANQLLRSGNNYYYLVGFNIRSNGIMLITEAEIKALYRRLLLKKETILQNDEALKQFGRYPWEKK